MKQRGFTLFEVLISLSIFLLISAAIFMAVAAGIKTPAAITQHRLHSERLDTLLSFFRSIFANLPPSTEISLQTHKGSAGEPVSELIFRRAPAIFSWMEKNSGGHVISLLAGTNGIGTLAIKSYRDTLSEDERKQFILEKTGWIPLLHGVQRIRWRFLETSSNSFLEQWNFGGRPRLIEMTLWKMGEEHPVIAQFWIPEILQITDGMRP